MSSHDYSVRCEENAENSKITRYFPPLPTKNLLEVTRINVCRQTKKRMISTQNNVLPKPLKGMTMQIRVRGNKTEFLRAVYDPAIKRTRQKLIKEDQFTDDERQQFQEYNVKREEQSKKSTLKYSAITATTQVENLAEALEQGFTIREPEKLLAALDRLNLALRKQGIKRPPKVRKALV